MHTKLFNEHNEHFTNRISVKSLRARRKKIEPILQHPQKTIKFSQRLIPPFAKESKKATLGPI